MHQNSQPTGLEGRAYAGESGDRSNEDEHLQPRYTDKIGPTWLVLYRRHSRSLDETNQLLVGNGDSAHMGRADHECRGKERGECKKKLGDEETLYENEDYIYTQSNP
ncbi:hypothetical protein OIU84_029603 [Salix udensis]|uniref:Uncharacterized protein n=1 Tax=Salix udensis TaxID=889485 RepID=A0AAD6P7B5_9ROSI|nr:hypothetical protein OIU84_029603 [Salix udensis]